MGERICEDCGLPVVICIAKDMVNEAAKQHGRAAVLSALDAAEARDVGVPELVWERASADAQDVSAKTCFGDYQISVDSAFAGESHYLWVAGQAEDDDPHATFPTMRKAKAAAQAHFAALHPASPLGAVAELVEAVERLNAACDAMWNDQKRLEENPSRFGQKWQLKEVHMKAISEAQQALSAALAPFTRKGE